MSHTQDLINVATAAEQLGLTPDAVRFAIRRGVLAAVAIDGRTRMVPRAEVERYRREHLGQRGRRKKQPATRPAEEE